MKQMECVDVAQAPATTLARWGEGRFMNIVDEEPATGEPGLPLWRLAYRFLWPFQYFRDVTCGDTLERQQNYRHNRAMRVYLPGFIMKWVILTGLCYSAGGALGQAGAHVLAAGCFVAACWTLIVVLLLSVDWVWLERFPDLY
jgi:hypothetical protein